MKQHYRRKFVKRKAKQLAKEEAATFKEASAVAEQQCGISASKVRHESANALDKTFINLSAHKIDSKPTIESTIVDSAASSLCCQTKAKIKTTGRISSKLFSVPTGQVAKAGKERELPHKLQPQAKVCHEVPTPEQDTLLSVPKLVDAVYTPILIKDGVEIYTTSDGKFIVSRAAVLRG